MSTNDAVLTVRLPGQLFRELAAYHYEHNRPGDSPSLHPNPESGSFSKLVRHVLQTGLDTLNQAEPIEL